MMHSAESFPWRWALLWAVLIGAIYFIPQALHWRQARNSAVLLEENYDEIVYAVWAARAANEHPGQPDPYQIIAATRQPASFATAQPLPAFALGTLAKWLRLPIASVFMAGSFVFPVLISLFVMLIAWCCGVRERWQLALSAAFSLLMLPPVLWLMQRRYMSSLLADVYPGFRLTLPYSRRSQPQFTAVIHYASIAFSLFAITSKSKPQRWLGGLLAGVAFGMSFYCYYFSWTLLFGWFVLGGFFIWLRQRESLDVWLTALVAGCVLAIPYVWLLLKNFGDISASAASARTHAFPQDPAIPVTLIVCAALAIALWLERQFRLLLWPVLVLNLVPVLGALQNVVTGIYIQPYHYLHYFARPATNLALVMLAIWLLQRWSLNKKYGQAWRVVSVVSLLVIFIISALFQWARYREVTSLAQESILAQPALQALQQGTPPGAVVYCPQATVREAIPLYTGAVSFFSLYMLLNETEATRQATQERIAAMQWLSGMSGERFANWLEARPLEAYFQALQQRIDAQSETRMRQRATALQASFAGIQPQAFASVRYALLPASTRLEATRLPLIFNLEKIWADEHYVLFGLTLK